MQVYAYVRKYIICVLYEYIQLGQAGYSSIAMYYISELGCIYTYVFIKYNVNCVYVYR